MDIDIIYYLYLYIYIYLFTYLFIYTHIHVYMYIIYTHAHIEEGFGPWVLAEPVSVLYDQGFFNSGIFLEFEVWGFGVRVLVGALRNEPPIRGPMLQVLAYCKRLSCFATSRSHLYKGAHSM